MSGDIEDLAANDDPPRLHASTPAHHLTGAPVFAGGAGGPVLVPGYGAGSNMVISGPAIVHPPAYWTQGGACPACGHTHHAHEESAYKGLPPGWHMPKDKADELATLQNMADKGAAPIALLGACQNVLGMLLRELPAPRPKEEELNLFQRAWRAVVGDPRPDPAAKARARPIETLEQAREDGVITESLLHAARRLPLDAGRASAPGTLQQFVSFLKELADAIYAQPARLS